MVHGSASRRRGPHGHQLVAIDADDDAGDGTGGHEAPHAGVGRRAQRHGGDDLPAHDVGERQPTSGDLVLDERYRGQHVACGFGDDDQVRERGPAPPALGTHPQTGQVEVSYPLPQTGVEPERFGGPHDVDRGVVGEEATDRLGEGDLIGGEPEVEHGLGHGCVP